MTYHFATALLKASGENKSKSKNSVVRFVNSEASSPTVAPPPPNPPSPPSPPITVSDGGANLDLIVRDPGIAG